MMARVLLILGFVPVCVLGTLLFWPLARMLDEQQELIDELDARDRRLREHVEGPLE